MRSDSGGSFQGAVVSELWAIWGTQHFAGPECHGGSAWVQFQVWLGSKCIHSPATV